MDQIVCIKYEAIRPLQQVPRSVIEHVRRFNGHDLKLSPSLYGFLQKILSTPTMAAGWYSLHSLPEAEKELVFGYTHEFYRKRKSGFPLAGSVKIKKSSKTNPDGSIKNIYLSEPATAKFNLSEHKQSIELTATKLLNQLMHEFPVMRDFFDQHEHLKGLQFLLPELINHIPLFQPTDRSAKALVPSVMRAAKKKAGLESERRIFYLSLADQFIERFGDPLAEFVFCAVTVLYADVEYPLTRKAFDVALAGLKSARQREATRN